MRFVHQWLLILLSLVPLIGLAWLWLSARAARRLSALVSEELQPRLAPVRRRGREAAQIVLALAGIALALVAAARPQWGRREQKVVSRSRNLLIALDVSRSMLAADVHPNRLERAKVDVLDLIGDLHGDRAGLLVFRHKASLLCPLTTDTAFLRQALDAVSIDAAPRGPTDLADAIRRGLQALEPALDEHNAILLISDGEDLEGRALEAAREAGKRRVPIFTVGIGDPAGADLPATDGKGAQQFEGQPVQTRLVDATLEGIARESGGTYIPLATAGTAHTTLGAIYRQHLRRIAAMEQQEQMERRYVERFQVFLVPGVCLLLAAAVLSRGRPAGARRAPAPTALAALLLTALPLVAPAATSGVPAAAAAPPAAQREAPAPLVQPPAAPPGRAGARIAQSLYRKGRYLEAAGAFVAASRGVEPEESRSYLYNAAVARFRAGDLAGAAALVAPIGSLPGQQASADLLGVCRYRVAGGTNDAIARAAGLEQSAAAFQQAWRGAPREDRARRNLVRALAPLPAAREEARIARVLKETGQTPPEQLASRMLQEQRALVREVPDAFTNEAPARIRKIEDAARRQDAQADLWIPLKKAVVESPALTNEQQRAWLAQTIETARDGMREAADRLRDLDGVAAERVAHGEPAVYTMWQMVVQPPGLIEENLALQSNALVRAGHPLAAWRPDQPEAGRLTGLFRERFPAWADQVVAQARTDTNAPSLSPENRAEIERLAEETQALQARAAKESADETRQPLQQRAVANLERIRELLPKQRQPQPQPQPQEQPPREQPQQQPQPQPQEKQEEQSKESPSEPQEQPRETPPPDVQELLRRALQREKEHAEEKRRQMQQIPLPPGERDW